MAEIIKGLSADSVWEQALEKIKNVDVTVSSRSGATYELLHVLIELSNPRQKWVINRFPPMNIGFALAELMWILGGRNDRHLIDFWNKNYSAYTADDGSDIYYGAYGYRLISKQGINQIERAYETLKKNLDSRQAVLQIWDAASDLPNSDGTPRSRDIPCNICSMLKVRGDKLEWTQIMRSNDVYLGLPYNIVQFTSLQEILAGWLEIEVGTYTQLSDSLHLYKEYKGVTDVVASSVSGIINTDSLSIPKSEFDSLLNEIINRMEKLINADAADDILSLGMLNSKFKAYNNVLLILAANVARRRNYGKVKRKLLNLCTNQCYLYLWNQWEEYLENLDAKK